MAGIALCVTRLLVTEVLLANFGFKGVPDEGRARSPPLAAHLVDQLEKLIINRHLNRLHGCGYQCGPQSTLYSTSDVRTASNEQPSSGLIMPGSRVRVPPFPPIIQRDTELVFAARLAVSAW